jgi:hypothetical protein
LQLREARTPMAICRPARPVCFPDERAISGGRSRAPLRRPGGGARVQFKARLEQLVRSAASHPKMAALLEVVLEHFRDAAAAAAAIAPPAAAAPAAAEPPASGGGGAGARAAPPAATAAAGAAGAAPAAVSRAIVFTNLRESVAAICALLAQHAPLVSAKCAPGPARGVPPAAGGPQERPHGRAPNLHAEEASAHLH